MQEYEEFKNKSIEIFAKANMELRQWEHSIVDHGSFNHLAGDQEEFSSVLGMRWNRRRDTLSCAWIPEIPETLSKRTLLAAINKILTLRESSLRP